MAFYRAIGFTVNPVFTFDDQKCMVWDDHIYVMLQTYDMYNSGIKKSIPDTKAYTTASFTLPVETVEKVNQLVEAGLKAGGKEPVPMSDVGFMQIRNLEDPDGHNWAIIFLDMEKFLNR